VCGATLDLLTEVCNSPDALSSSLEIQLKGALMARPRVLLLLTLGALASTAAFVVPYASGARAATYNVTAVDFKFKGVPSRVTAGKITFRIVNRGTASHDFKIAGKKTRLLSTGQRVTLTVTLRKGRRYPFLCTVPGHSTLGMKGTVIAR
jgi:plastocyanin